MSFANLKKATNLFGRLFWCFEVGHLWLLIFEIFKRQLIYFVKYFFKKNLENNDNLFKNWSLKEFGRPATMTTNVEIGH